MARGGESIVVEIFGRTYHVISNDDKAYINHLAAMIHDKMVQIDRSTKTIDSVRVAVLAALNMADEYCKLKIENEKRIHALEQEHARLLNLIEGALEESSSDSLPDA